MIMKLEYLAISYDRKPIFFSCFTFLRNERCALVKIDIWFKGGKAVQIVLNSKFHSKMCIYIMHKLLLHLIIINRGNFENKNVLRDLKILLHDIFSYIQLNL